MFLAKAFQTDPRPRQEAKSLANAGYSVFVLAWDRERQFNSIENVDGAMVHSLEYLHLGRSSGHGLALGAIILQILLFLETLRLVGRLGARPMVHAHDLNTLLPACLLRRLGISVGLVYDSHELSYAAYGEFFNPVMGRIIQAIENRYIGYADAVLTASEGVAGYLRRFNPRIEVVYNCPQAADIPRISRAEARSRLDLPLSAVIVSSVGTVRYDSELDLLIRIATFTKKQNIQYLIVGDGPSAPGLRDAARAAGDIRLTILPRVSRETALLLVLASDLTWAVYRHGIESLNPRVNIPWKFFESLACGVPLIVEEGTAKADLVRKFECGVVLESDDLSYISQAILSLVDRPNDYQNMCARAKQAFILQFSWEAMSIKLIHLYRDLLHATASGTRNRVKLSRSPLSTSYSKKSSEELGLWT
jgi:glycosyltransferase involved in cell wall biosynthesis